GATTIDTVHQDIIETHILTRLDGPTLASACCASSQLYTLASQEQLWINICHSTWPSTTTPRVLEIISKFPAHGPRSFFSASFTSPDGAAVNSASAPAPPYQDCPSELISAVDIYYRENLVFSRVIETETVSDWFRCSPFRIDLLDPKDTVATPIRHPDDEDTCRGLGEDLSLSWILIDPVGRRAMNLSSHLPVTVQRHWLTGEVHVRFASLLTGRERMEIMECVILVTCGGNQAGEMHVREVSLQVQDMDGVQWNGKDSLVILERGLEGKRGRWGRRDVEGKKRYVEFLEMKRERREKKLRSEGILDIFCLSFGVLIFASLVLFILW
ncbi:hypothetical protein CFOL_v3_02993, partial [Cephalotus follicularis]